ncbi:MAG: helix-hairpin-helix domain-containing protein [Bacteroidota bacterium]
MMKKDKIDINKATYEQLISQKGVGKKTAEYILDYRKENGRINDIAVLDIHLKNSIVQVLQQNFKVEQKVEDTKQITDLIQLKDDAKTVVGKKEKSSDFVQQEVPVLPIDEDIPQDKQKIPDFNQEIPDQRHEIPQKDQKADIDDTKRECQFEILEKEIMIFGTPQNLVCNLTIRNIGKEMKHFVPITFTSREELLPGDILKPIRLRSRLYPNQVKKFTLSVEVNQCIMPGEYPMQMHIDNCERDVILCVEEFHSIDVRPDTFYIHSRPGDSVTKNIFVTNNGNTTVNFHSPGFVFLSDRFAHCRVLKSGARKIKEPMELGQMVQIAATEIDNLYRETSSLLVKVVDSKQIEIPPETTKKVTLEIKIPKTLKNPNIYKGRYRFYDSSIAFDVIPSSYQIQ